MMPQRSLRALKMQLSKRLKDNRILRIAVLCILAALAAVSVYQGAKNALEFSQDLQWDAAKALAMRVDPYELSQNPDAVYDHPPLAEFYRMFTDKGLEQKMEANQFPSLLMLLFPITLLPPAVARCVWLILNLAFTAGIVYLAKKTIFEKADATDYLAMILLMLAGTPYRNQLGVGQHTLFAFFFFMLALYIDKTRTEGTSKMILTALCLFVSFFKYTLTAPLALYFLYKKRYRELALAAALHILLTIAAAVWLGKDIIYMIKAPLEVASRLASEGGIDLGALLGGKMYIIAAAVFTVGLTVMSIRMKEGEDDILLALLILWSLVLTYHRTYDFFVLTFAAVPFLTDEGAAGLFTKREKSFFALWYVLVVLAVYFLLRVFNENQASIIGVGIIYYVFMFAYTFVCAKAALSQE